VQVIAFLTAVFGKRGNENDKKRMRLARDRDLPYPRVLIICPGSVMSNWERELSTVIAPPNNPPNILKVVGADFGQWGWWHTALYHGQNKSSNLSTASSGRLEILITTYTTYKQNQQSVNMVPWDIVIADECHIIKERKSDVTQQMAEINSRVRIGLTGTAIQNNYEVPQRSELADGVLGVVDVVGLDLSGTGGEYIGLDEQSRGSSPGRTIPRRKQSTTLPRQSIQPPPNKKKKGKSFY
jgi:SNF2-related domain